MKSYYIDRIEEEFVICENEQREFLTFCKKYLPSSIGEGDIITLSDKKWEIDYNQTKLRREKAYKLLQKLFKEGEGK